MKPVTIIVGADQGLGLAITEKFGQEGHRVILIARNRDKLAADSQSLTKKGIENAYYPADVSQLAKIDSLLKKISQEQGKPANLIFNVADTRSDTALSSDMATIKEMLATNTLSAIQCARSFITYSDSKAQRNILFTNGWDGDDPAAAASTLSLTKAALRSYAITLHAAIEKDDIFSGLVTIEQPIGKTPEMAPANIANAFWVLTQKRQPVEVHFPGTNSL
ncbi:SDR family NAD(P)-dependent oxidoreductase [Lactobacillus selangorensis]|nr:SDR family NAD(P)-dependent oxidoreductase [Lactobacillus selangorensis]